MSNMLPSLPTMPPAHARALADVLEQAANDPEVIGLLFCGSTARGTALPGSDLDLRLFLRPDTSNRAFTSINWNGLEIETSARTITAAREKLTANEMEVYPYLEGIALYDPYGDVAKLKMEAESIYANFRSSGDAKSGMAFWLESAQRKIASRMVSGDVEGAAYVAATTSRPILEGLFVAANRPPPPSGVVLSYLGDACERIGDVLTPEQVARLWTAEIMEERCCAALDILAWIIPILRAPTA